MIQQPTEPTRVQGIPSELPVLPLRDAVVFPHAIAPLAIGQERSLRLIDDAWRGNKLLALVAQRNREIPRAGPGDVYRVGTAAVLHHVVRAPDGMYRVIVQGLNRIHIGEFVRTEPYLVAQVQTLPEAPESGMQIEALARSVRELFKRLVNETSPELASAADGTSDPRQLLYLVASGYAFSTQARQELLELGSLRDMLRRMIELLQHELAVGELQEKLTSDTRESLNKVQREHILREQLKAIRKELGEEVSEEAEQEELERKVEEAGLSEEARKEADRELERLRRIPPASPEYGIIRTFLEWLVSLPWKVQPSAPIDVPHAREVLDADHYDLEKVKDRILEHLAVKKLRDERGAPVERSDVRGEPILCLVGPPGVGKTSLGQSVARAMGRKFVRISLGGIHDEAEIRGHRRTYIGAMPGRIIQALRRAEANDPIFMLDEVDKLGTGFHGDPAAALLEVLDPAQNRAFVDTYLGVPFDLTRVLFICTANTTDTVPPPLLDRMEVLRIPGYTDEEKVQICRRYLMPALLQSHGMRPEEVSIDEGAIRRVIREYTREAGVRNLERLVAELIRKAARSISEGTAPPISVDAEAVRRFLGPPRFFDDVSERIDRPGVSTGLAWTPVGGEILFVEVAAMPARESRLILTGMLGDVMRESAQAALTYLRSNAERLGFDPAFFTRKAVHVHVPAGATPKDGPSAGVAILLALASLARDQVVDPTTAVTGEITLRGKVLPVGGIKEKVLAAHRAGLKRVVLPRRNESSLEDVPSEVKGALQFTLVDSADEVIRLLLGPIIPYRRPAPEAEYIPPLPQQH